MEKIKIAEKISNWKIDVKNIRIAGEKTLDWNIIAKNSRLVNCCEIFWVEKCKKKKRSEIGEKFQGENLLWKILVGRSVKKTIMAGEKL